MNPQTTVDLVRQLLMMSFWIALPLLAVGFFVGICVSLMQIVTSMQDPAFSAVPRLAAFLAALLLFLPWMLQHLMEYTAGILGNLQHYAR
jgi:flagellar biosynthetic protein FliQ